MAPSAGERSGEQFIPRKEFRQGSESGFRSGSGRPCEIIPRSQARQRGDAVGACNRLKIPRQLLPVTPAWGPHRKAMAFCFSHQEEKRQRHKAPEHQKKPNSNTCFSL